MAKLFDFLSFQDLKNRRIKIFGDITEESAYLVIQQTDYLSQKAKDPIHILIHSAGGCVASELAIVDQINLLKDEGIIIQTMAAGSCYSAAATILAVGSKEHRFVRRHSMIMLHPESYSLSHDYAQQQERTSIFFKKQQDQNSKMLAEACGQNYKKFIKDIQHGLWLSAEEAIKYGVADKFWGN